MGGLVGRRSKGSVFDRGDAMSDFENHDALRTLRIPLLFGGERSIRDSGDGDDPPWAP